MAFERMPGTELRAEKTEVGRLAWAFAISLCFHLLVFGTYQTGKRLGWWQLFHLPAWTRSTKTLAEILKKQQEKQEMQRQEEIPLVFVEVSPAQVTPEPPKQAKFYSNKNSQAANKEADKNTDSPKFEGKRPEVAKTEDVPREQFVPLQPTPPPPPPKQEPKPEEPKPEVKPDPKPQEAELKPAPTQKPGDLTLAKPDPTPKKDDGQEKAPLPKPRTVQEAKARLEASQMPGQKMKQEGGVMRDIKIDSLDAKATLYGDYDYRLVRAIQSYWYHLLDEQKYAADYRGKVVVRFHLHYDGNVTEVNVVESTAGTIPSYLCQSAIEKPKPFPRFPAEMRSAVGDIRSIQFTFFYD